MPVEPTSEGSGRRWLDSARSAVLILHILRIPIFCTMFTALCLVVPEQMTEILRALTQNFLLFRSESQPRIEIGFAAAGLLALVVGVWWIAGRLIWRLGDLVPVPAQPALDWAVRGLVLVMMAAVAYALYQAQTPVPTGIAEDAVREELKRIYPNLRGTAPFIKEALDITVGQLFSYNRVLVYASIATALFGLLLAVSLPVRKPAPPLPQGAKPAPLFGRTINALVFGAVIAVIGLFIVSQVTVPQTIGVLAVFFVFVLCLLPILAQLSYKSDLHGIPWLAIFVVIAVALSLLDWNDNHSIYRPAPRPAIVAESTPLSVPRDFDQAFLQWWEARASFDRSRYEQSNRPYPVYVVAAQGGGMYAAFHTASILGNLQERCPAFAHHLFAISSVSGGSIGAATFAGLIKQTESAALSTAVAKPCRDAERPGSRSMVDLADNLLSSDLLSPLVAGLTFPDFLQKFLPVPVPRLDRVLPREKAFENAMDETIADLAKSRRADKGQGPNFFTSRFVDHWSPHASTPALVINTTEVGSGRRRAIAPFQFARDSLLFMPIWETFPANSQAARASDLPVSTAAILSARFPWITPAGTFEDYERDRNGEPRRDKPLRRFRLVDGGYFENSGVATALDLIRTMEDAAGRHGFADKIRIRLIVLTRGGYPEQTFYGLNDAITPVQALLSTRTSRAYITIAEAERLLNAAIEVKALASTHHFRRLHKIDLLDLGYSPPLGWRLSPITLFLIRAQNGIDGRCKTAPGQSGRHGRFDIEDADCLLQDIASELNAEKPK